MASSHTWSLHTNHCTNLKPFERHSWRPQEAYVTVVDRLETHLAVIKWVGPARECSNLMEHQNIATARRPPVGDLTSGVGPSAQPSLFSWTTNGMDKMLGPDCWRASLVFVLVRGRGHAPSCVIASSTALAIALLGLVSGVRWPSDSVSGCCGCIQCVLRSIGVC